MVSTMDTYCTGINFQGKIDGKTWNLAIESWQHDARKDVKIKVRRVIEDGVRFEISMEKRQSGVMENVALYSGLAKVFK